jgi:hypothetical protein
MEDQLNDSINLIGRYSQINDPITDDAIKREFVAKMVLYRSIYPELYGKLEPVTKAYIKKIENECPSTHICIEDRFERIRSDLDVMDSSLEEMIGGLEIKSTESTLKEKGYMFFHDCSLSYVPKSFAKKDRYSDEYTEMFVYSTGTIEHAYFPFCDVWTWPPWYKDQLDCTGKPKSEWKLPNRESLDRGRVRYAHAMREFWPEYEDPPMDGFMKKLEVKM